MGVILLVRHGQASFGTEDYDRLSERGVAQVQALGRALAARGFLPSQVVAGSMRRQRGSAAALVEAAGWHVPVVTEAGWDEFDHDGLVSARSAERVHDSKGFQVVLDAAMAEWASSGGAGAAESFDRFTSRARGALDAVARACGRGEDALVVSSAGVISWLAAMMIGGGPAQWIALNRVCVNSAVTTVVSGRRGTSLLTFNEHAHLAAGEITYR